MSFLSKIFLGLLGLFLTSSAVIAIVYKNEIFEVLGSSEKNPSETVQK